MYVPPGADPGPAAQRTIDLLGGLAVFDPTALWARCVAEGQVGFDWAAARPGDLVFVGDWFCDACGGLSREDPAAPRGRCPWCGKGAPRIRLDEVDVLESTTVRHGAAPTIVLGELRAYELPPRVGALRIHRPRLARLYGWGRLE